MDETTPRRHETRDLSLRAIVMFGLGLVVFGGLSHVLLLTFFGTLGEREDRRDAPPPPLREARVEPPEPRLQQDPGRSLAEMRRLEEEHLKTYGWVDREHGVVRMPIDRAMKLVAERGLPARPAQRTAD